MYENSHWAIHVLSRRRKNVLNQSKNALNLCVQSTPDRELVNSVISDANAAPLPFPTQGARENGIMQIEVAQHGKGWDILAPGLASARCCPRDRVGLLWLRPDASESWWRDTTPMHETRGRDRDRCNRNGEVKARLILKAIWKLAQDSVNCM
jgi:hypothetical protein